MPTATDVVRKWGDTLSRVAAGEEVEVTRHGRKVAVVKRHRRPLTGEEAAEVFRRVEPDPEAADAVEAEVKKYRDEFRTGGGDHNPTPRKTPDPSPDANLDPCVDGTRWEIQ